MGANHNHDDHKHEDHGHGHGHSHGGHGHSHVAPTSFNTAFAIAVTLTLTYTCAEAGYAFYANSMSLLADAVHNLGDVLGLILSWIANWLLSLPARKRYSYGFKRTSVFASLLNAFILVATSALIAYEAVYKLLNPVPMSENIVMIVGTIGIFVNVGCSLLFMRGAKDDLNIRSAFWHLMADALILIGVVIGAFVVSLTGWNWLDPLIGLIIVGIVLWGTWSLLTDSVNLMLDAVPRHINHVGVMKYLETIPGVTAVHDLHIWGLSTREVALTAHLVMPEKPLNDADHLKLNDQLRKQFNINHVTIQVEHGELLEPCGRSEKC